MRWLCVYERLIKALLEPKSVNSCINAMENVNKLKIPLPSAPKYLETKLTEINAIRAIANLEVKFNIIVRLVFKRYAFLSVRK